MVDTLPLIDLRGLEGHTRSQTVRAIREAAEEVGFFAVSHTGVPSSTVEDAFAVARSFFSRPDRQKAPWQYRSTELNHGWVCVGQEALDPANPPDRKESFTMRDVGHTRQVESLWPDTIFREAVSRFYETSQRLARRLLEALAEGLDLPSNWFLQSHTGENQTLRLLHYPAQGQSLRPGELGAGAHTDYGSITLLWQDAVGGLEVKDRGGNWIRVAPQAGSVIVNIGDLMQRWTQDVLRSTQHRVQPRTDGRDRYSIAFFCDPDSATEISVVPTCLALGQTPRYPPILAGDHIRSKLNSTY